MPAVIIVVRSPMLRLLRPLPAVSSFETELSLGTEMQVTNPKPFSTRGAKTSSGLQLWIVRSHAETAAAGSAAYGAAFAFVIDQHGRVANFMTG